MPVALFVVVFVFLLLALLVVSLCDKSKFWHVYTRGNVNGYVQKYLLIHNVPDGDEVKEILNFCKTFYKVDDNIRECDLYFFKRENSGYAKKGIAANYMVHYKLDKDSGISELRFWDSSKNMRV